MDSVNDTRRRLITTTEGRVAYLNALRSVVSRHCPLNKMGTPIVSDYDLIDATEEEQAEALATVVKRLKLTTPEIPITP